MVVATAEQMPLPSPNRWCFCRWPSTTGLHWEPAGQRPIQLRRRCTCRATRRRSSRRISVFPSVVRGAFLEIGELPFVEVKTARVLASTCRASDLTVIFIWLSSIEQGGVKVDGRTILVALISLHGALPERSAARRAVISPPVFDRPLYRRFFLGKHCISIPIR